MGNAIGTCECDVFPPTVEPDVMGYPMCTACQKPARRDCLVYGTNVSDADLADMRRGGAPPHLEIVVSPQCGHCIATRALLRARALAAKDSSIVIVYFSTDNLPPSDDPVSVALDAAEGVPLFRWFPPGATQPQVHVGAFRTNEQLHAFLYGGPAHSAMSA